jgi:putative nucleotidyltransferase with HDIG domain
MSVDELTSRLAGPRRVLADSIGHVMEIARKIDSRDGGTKRHSQVVAHYAELTARELDLPEDVVDDIRLAGLLHDVGKSAIPERILAKPGPLSDIEWLEMRRHPWIAVELLENSGLDEIREWIYCHHERPDGNGYPRGTRGEDIPLAARIISVADAFDVMTARDSYRRPIGTAAAIAELRRVAGTQLDPRVVEVFVGLVEGGSVAFAHADDADLDAELATDRRTSGANP